MNRKISESDKRPLVPQLPTETVIKQIGAGGTGAIVARYGLLLLASLVEAQNVKARWVLIDGDQFEPSNRTRTAFPRYGNKAEVVVEQLVGRLESAPLTLTPITEYVTETSIERLLHDGDMVLVCVDNHATRKLVSDYCGEHLNEFAIISGGNDAIGEDRRGRYLRGTYLILQTVSCGRSTFRRPDVWTTHDRSMRRTTVASTSDL